MDKSELLKLAEIEEALAARIKAEQVASAAAFKAGPDNFRRYLQTNPGANALLPYLPVAEAKALALRALAKEEG